MKDILFIKKFGTNKCECGSNKSVVGVVSGNKKEVLCNDCLRKKYPEPKPKIIIDEIDEVVK